MLENKNNLDSSSFGFCFLSRLRRTLNFNRFFFLLLRCRTAHFKVQWDCKDGSRGQI